MRLILTRPEKDARALAEKLRARGHGISIVPLLEIIPRRGVMLPQRSYQAVCITSANGLANAKLVEGLQEVRLLCVGPQSSAAATHAGFRHVEAHGGDVDGLTSFITSHLQPSDGPLLYLSGAATSGDLEGKLRKAGFDVDRIVAYDAENVIPLRARSVGAMEVRPGKRCLECGNYAVIRKDGCDFCSACGAVGGCG